MGKVLEAPDAPITLRRASELCGLAPNTLRWQHFTGRLEAELFGRDLVTTRRKLHRYGTNRKPGSKTRPLPNDYEAPERGGQ